MNVAIDPQMREFVEEKLYTGQYATAEEVVRAALALLRQQDELGEFDVGELDALLAQGERSLEAAGPIDAEVVFDELRRKSSDRRAGTS